MINNSSVNYLTGNAEDLGHLLFREQQRFSDKLEKVFESNKEYTSNEIYEHAHHSPKFVRCSLCLIGLNENGSNFDECLQFYNWLHVQVNSNWDLLGEGEFRS